MIRELELQIYIYILCRAFRCSLNELQENIYLLITRSSHVSCFFTLLCWEETRRMLEHLPNRWNVVSDSWPRLQADDPTSLSDCPWDSTEVNSNLYLFLPNTHYIKGFQIFEMNQYQQNKFFKLYTSIYKFKYS